MKLSIKYFLVAIGLALNLILPANSQAASPSPQFLVTKIVKAGLGCNPVTEKTWLFSSGTRWNCKVNGEDITIEIYPAAQWKRIQSAVCPPNYGFIAVTDSKTWIVIPESRVTAKKLVKPLGGTLKVFCDAKHIKNEVKAESSTPSPSSKPASSKPSPKSSINPKPSTSPSPKPSLKAPLGSEDNPFSLGAQVGNQNFSILVKAFLPDATNLACGDLYAASYSNSLCGAAEGEINPSRTERYIGFTLEIKNLGNEADFATHSADYFALHPGTYYYAENDFAGYPMDKLLVNVDPGETISVNVYFREPIDVIQSQIKLKIEQGNKTFYFATK